MMQVFVAALVLCLTVCTASSAEAQTQAEIDACKADALRLCKPQTEAIFLTTLRVMNCMLSHRAQLSARCNAVFLAHGY